MKPNNDFPKRNPEIKPPLQVPGWPSQEPPEIDPEHENDPAPSGNPPELEPVKTIPEIKPETEIPENPIIP